MLCRHSLLFMLINEIHSSKRNNHFIIIIFSAGWMQQQQQQQNFLLLPDAAVKQEPLSPNYVDLASTSNTPPPPNQRYTPSPNTLHSTSMSPNIPIQGISQQPQYDMGNYIPSVSPLQNANILNQQYRPQTNNPNQFNIPNATMVNAAVNFMNNNSNQSNQTEQRNIEDILTNNHLDNINQLDNVANTNNENVLDNVSSMNISSLLDLDSQQQINSNLLLTNDLLSDLIKNLDNGETGMENQGAIPITINAIQANNFGADEENMTDSFKQISIE